MLLLVMAALRRFQQSYWSHALVAAFLAGLAAYFTASPGVALGAGVSAFVLSIQHSPGSSAFKGDGTPNKAVTDLVAIQAAAPTSSVALEVSNKVARTVAVTANQVAKP